MSPSQSSFISGQSSVVNIILVQEATHSFTKKKAKSVCMMLKVDLGKAYD